MDQLLSLSRAPQAITVLAAYALSLLLVLALSLALLRFWRAYRWHMVLQTLLGLGLLIVFVAFEYQVRVYGWRPYAQDSVYYDSWVMPSLILHLCFAIPCLGLWAYLIPSAWINFATSKRSSRYTERHKKLGGLAALLMVGTVGTGHLFFFLAFVC